MNRPAPATVEGSPLLVSLRPRTVAVALGLPLLLIILLGLAATFTARERGGWLPNSLAWRFMLNSRLGVPRLFNAVLLLFSALLSAACTAANPNLRGRWRLAALAGLALAVDELAELHLTLMPWLRAWVAAAGGGPAFQSAAWLLVLGPPALVFAALWLPALRHLPRRTANWLLAASGGYVLSAVGGALAAGWLWQADGPGNLLFMLVTAAFEVAEQAALIGLIGTLLDYLTRTSGTVTVRLIVPRQSGVLNLSPRAVGWLAGLALVLAAMHGLLFVVIQPSGYGPEVMALLRRWHLDLESTLPAAFSTLQLALAALLLGAITLARRAAGDRLCWRWLALTMAFVALTLDESAALHELITVTMAETLDLPGALGVAWYLPLLPLVALLGLFCLDLVLRLPRRTRLLVLAAGTIYVTGAVGFELAGALIQGNFGYGRLYLVEVMLEETLEMLGITLFIYALLDYLARTWGSVALRLTNAPKPSA